MKGVWCIKFKMQVLRTLYKGGRIGGNPLHKLHPPIENFCLSVVVVFLADSISQQRISSVAVNPTGEWLAFGCSSLGQLLVWEWQSETYVLKQQGHFYDMNCLAYSPDGQLIATGGDDSKVGMA